MKLSPHEVADLVIKAGFSKTTIVAGTTDSEAVVAVAIAFAESGGDTDAISRTTAAITSDPASVGNRDHGLFQLSGRWQYPKIQAVGGNWRDPVVNTKIAYDIFKANKSFSPWTTFTAKNTAGVSPYQQYLPDARLGVAQPWPYVDLAGAKLDKLTADVAKLSAAMNAQALTANTLAATLAEVRKHFV